MGGVIIDGGFAVKLVNEEKREEARIARVNSIISAFEGLLKLKPTNEHYHDFYDGFWIVRTNNCVINYKTEVSLVSEHFSEYATPDELKAQMLSMIEESNKQIETIKEVISEIENSSSREEYRIIKLKGL